MKWIEMGRLRPLRQMRNRPHVVCVIWLEYCYYQAWCLIKIMYCLYISVFKPFLYPFLYQRVSLLKDILIFGATRPRNEGGEY